VRKARGRVVAAWMATAVLGVAAAGAPAAPPATAPGAIVAKTCGGRFVHGVIDGAEKCLARGEFCARAAGRQYRRYGFHCTRRDANGRYDLT
jgi:ABC-type sugar transport system substrate-binding protein